MLQGTTAAWLKASLFLFFTEVTDNYKTLSTAHITEASQLGCTWQLLETPSIQFLATR